MKLGILSFITLLTLSLGNVPSYSDSSVEYATAQALEKLKVEHPELFVRGGMGSNSGSFADFSLSADKTPSHLLTPRIEERTLGISSKEWCDQLPDWVGCNFSDTNGSNQ